MTDFSSLFNPSHAFQEHNLNLILRKKLVCLHNYIFCLQNSFQIFLYTHSDLHKSCFLLAVRDLKLLCFQSHANKNTCRRSIFFVAFLGKYMNHVGSDRWSVLGSTHRFHLSQQTRVIYSNFSLLCVECLRSRVTDNKTCVMPVEPLSGCEKTSKMIVILHVQTSHCSCTEHKECEQTQAWHKWECILNARKQNCNLKEWKCNEIELLYGKSQTQ